MPTAITNRAGKVTPDAPQGQMLQVVPILGPSHDQPAYELLRGATLSAVKVSEISSAGSVPELRVQNELDVRVFLMDGQELVGAKQNRILNTDVLVPAKQTITIPVSCVEHGRWRSISANFIAGKSASYSTRAGKSERVRASLKREGKHDADQSAVWNEVAACLSLSETSSPTAALSDAYAKREDDLNRFRTSIQMPPEAVGLAMFHGGRFAGLDLFDRHSTLSYFWQSLLESYAIELLDVAPVPQPASPQSQQIRELLDRAADGKWEKYPSPGEGEDWRLDDEQLSGSSLLWESQTVLHMQLFPKQPTTAGSRAGFRPRIRRPYLRE